LPDTLSTPTSNITWELLKSILLWGALLAVLLFALTHFLRQHNGLLPALRSLRIVDWMKQAWGWLYRNANRTREELARALKGGWQNLITRLERRRVLSRPGWISLRTLDPRRKVYFYYLAMLRRAAKEGYVRKPSQTPLEYALQLERNVPSAVEDIESLTDAFVEARYSRQPVESSKAALIKETWGRIRRALQVRSKDGQS
jgi:hypothetical protein